MFELVVMKVRSSERHHKISKTNQGRIWIREKADHHMSIEHGHSRLIPVQDALLEGFGWAPVKHPRGIVFHFCLFKVKVFGLVVSNAHLDLVCFSTSIVSL